MIFHPFYQEFLQMRKRLERLEQELKKLQESPKVGTVEYHIENLTVESIQNGILDLGVHMGNETDNRIQNGMQQDETKRTLKERIHGLEQEMREVKDQLQRWQERWESMEERWRSMGEQSESLDRRLRYLEAMHP